MSWSDRVPRYAPLFLCLLLSACAGQGHPVEPGSRYVHVVFIWLKAPDDGGQIDQLVTATRDLQRIPGVREVRVGRAVPSGRQAVDDSFDVGLYLVFDSRADLDAYQHHPLHQAAVRNTLAPLAARYLIYDFVDVCAACAR